MATLEERDDPEGAVPRVPARRRTKRHYQAVIQAEIRRLARALDSDIVSSYKPADAPVMDHPSTFGEVR
jgi:hypothetical protein